MKKYGMVLRSVGSSLRGWRVANRRLMAAGANRVLFLIKINLLVFVSVWSLVSITNTFAQNEFNEEHPILIFTTDICEIEITPYELDLRLEAPVDFYTVYESRMHCEPPPGQYKCKGCRDKSATIYECYHESMDPNEPCDINRCIRNEIRLKSCYVSDRGQEDCRVVIDPNPNTWHARQYLIRTDVPCRSRSQNPQVAFEAWVGCPLCSQFPVVIRCKVASCSGIVVDESTRPCRFLCVNHPCPPPTH